MADTADELGDYVSVAKRIAEVREKLYPTGTFQPAQLERPYTIETIGEQAYVAYVAAFYRTPDDPKPGIGMAWERVPGVTPYTEGSELQNAETSAWGRALVAALVADTTHGVASADEVRNRAILVAKDLAPADLARAELLGLLNRRGTDLNTVMAWFRKNHPQAGDIRTSDDAVALREAISHFDGGDAA
jgi:hypothetical protein